MNPYGFYFIIITSKADSDHEPVEDNYLKQGSSWEPKCPIFSQEILHLLWEWRVNYGGHNSLPQEHVLNHFIPIHTLTPYFFTIHFNITIPFVSTSHKWSASFFHISQLKFYNSEITIYQVLILRFTVDLKILNWKAATIS